MTAPKRLLEDTTIGPDVAQLLRAGTPRNMSEAERMRTHRRVLRIATIPVVAGVLITAKSVALAALLGATVTTAVLVAVPHLRTAPTSAFPQQASVAPSAEQTPVPIPQTSTISIVEEEPSALPAMPPTPSTKPVEDTLGQEAAQLELARSHLNTAPEQALGLLDDYAKAYQHPHLAAEAELLRIQALQKAGRTVEARARAEAMIRRHPNGLYAERLRAMFPAASAAEDGGS